MSLGQLRPLPACARAAFLAAHWAACLCVAGLGPGRAARPMRRSRPGPAQRALEDARRRSSAAISKRSRPKSRSARSASAEIRAEIEALDGDASQLGLELVAAGQRIDLAGEDVRVIEDRLAGTVCLRAQSCATGLDGHDHSISNLLASLQRISAQPPPAIIVDPADALGSARAAMLLGAVLPQLQHRAADGDRRSQRAYRAKDSALR